jgi:hypothetical protein
MTGAKENKVQIKLSSEMALLNCRLGRCLSVIGGYALARLNRDCLTIKAFEGPKRIARSSRTFFYENSEVPKSKKVMSQRLNEKADV